MNHLPPTPPPGPILGLSIKVDANFYYRIINPLRNVKGATWATYDTVSREQLEAAQTVLINRAAGPVNAMQRIFESLRNKWRIETILSDFDDSWLTPHKVKGVRVKPDVIEGVKYSLQQSDGVIVTNEDSRSHYRQYTSTPIAIMPNLSCPADWDVPAVRQGQPPVVLVGGSPSHRYDWDVLVPALTELRKQLPHVGLRVLGCPHPAIKRLRTEGQEWTHDLATYAGLLKGATIALCPLEDNEFNKCKGAAKPAEYSLGAGCAVIGSAIQYANILDRGRGIVIDPSAPPGAWAEAIDFYLCNEYFRWQHACNLRDFVADEQHIGRWSSYCTSLYTMEESSWRCSLMEQMGSFRLAPQEP